MKNRSRLWLHWLTWMMVVCEIGGFALLQVPQDITFGGTLYGFPMVICISGLGPDFAIEETWYVSGLIANVAIGIVAIGSSAYVLEKCLRAWRERFQFSLRTLFVVQAVCAVSLGLLSAGISRSDLSFLIHRIGLFFSITIFWCLACTVYAAGSLAVRAAVVLGCTMGCAKPWPKTAVGILRSLQVGGLSLNCIAALVWNLAPQPAQFGRWVVFPLLLAGTGAFLLASLTRIIVWRRGVAACKQAGPLRSPRH